MRFLILDGSGNRLGDFANPQNMTQPAYAGCSQVEVADNDPRLVLPLPAPPQPTLHIDDLAALLVSKGVLQAADVTAIKK